MGTLANGKHAVKEIVQAFASGKIVGGDGIVQGAFGSMCQDENRQFVFLFGDAPIIYTGGGTTYTMEVTLTTKSYYYDSSGNRRQHTTGTSFSHNVNWKP